MSYRQLFRIMYPPLKAFAFSILKNREQAEEVASDVMISLWRDKHKLLEIKNIMVYGYVTAKNKSLNLLKARNGRAVSIDEIEIDIVFNAPNPEQILITEELRKNLQQAVQWIFHKEANCCIDKQHDQNGNSIQPFFKIKRHCCGEEKEQNNWAFKLIDKNLYRVFSFFFCYLIIAILLKSFLGCFA